MFIIVSFPIFFLNLDTVFFIPTLVTEVSFSKNDSIKSYVRSFERFLIKYSRIRHFANCKKNKDSVPSYFGFVSEYWL